MYFYHHQNIKIATLVVFPTAGMYDHIDHTRATDKYWSNWRYENLFNNVDDWRITQMLTESALNSFLTYIGEPQDINSFYISLEDFINNDFDDSYYFEIPMSFWYILKNRKDLFEGKNVVLSMPAECFFVGQKCDQLYYPSLIYQDDTAFSDLNYCKTASVVWDNIDPRNKERFPHINWIPSNLWLPEYAHTQERLLPNTIEFRRNLRDNVLKKKKHNFVALLGKTKMHRVDFANQVLENNLHIDNEVGTNFNEEHEDYIQLKLKYEKTDNFQYHMDRDMQPEWYQECKVWISLETVCNDPSIPDNELQFCQLTEKTFKPMAYGMPFLLNGGYGIFEYIEQLGFKTFTDVFGNYATDDYRETNKNIIEILQNLDRYDWNIIADHCEHNHDLLMKWNKSRTLELLFENLLMAIK